MESYGFGSVIYISIILDSHGSNYETPATLKVFSWFSSVPPCKFQDSTSIRPISDSSLFFINEVFCYVMSGITCQEIFTAVRTSSSNWLYYCHMIVVIIDGVFDW
jgi:hypothetical protein